MDARLLRYKTACTVMGLIVLLTLLISGWTASARSQSPDTNRGPWVLKVKMEQSARGGPELYAIKMNTLTGETLVLGVDDFPDDGDAWVRLPTKSVE